MQRYKVTHTKSTPTINLGGLGLGVILAGVGIGVLLLIYATLKGFNYA